MPPANYTRSIFSCVSSRVTSLKSPVTFTPKTHRWSTLLAATDRQRFAVYLYGEREWSQQRIAEALRVSQRQISTDLREAEDRGELEVTSNSQPKRGRPRKPSNGNGKPRPMDLAVEWLEQNRSQLAVCGGNLTKTQAQQQSPVSWGTFNQAWERLGFDTEPEPEPEPAPTESPPEELPEVIADAQASIPLTPDELAACEAAKAATAATEHEHDWEYVQVCRTCDVIHDTKPDYVNDRGEEICICGKCGQHHRKLL
jgi:hypothetical protein